EERHHLRAGDESGEAFGDLDLQRMRQGEEAATLELTPHRLVDGGMGVPERDRRQAHHVVDVLVAVHIPDPAATPTLQENRIGPLDEHARGLTQCLRYARNHLAGSSQIVHRTVKPARVGTQMPCPPPPGSTKSRALERSRPSFRRIPALSDRSSGRRPNNSSTSAIPKMRAPSGSSSV